MLKEPHKRNDHRIAGNFDMHSMILSNGMITSLMDNITNAHCKLW